MAAKTALRLIPHTIALECSDEDALCFLASHFHVSGRACMTPSLRMHHAPI